MDNKNVKAKRKAYEIVMHGLAGLCAALTAALVLFLIAYVLIKGIPNISWEFLSSKPSYLADSVGILPDILNTLYIVLGTLVWVLPLGVGAAIYLTEYASSHRIVGAIESAAETLKSSSRPSNTRRRHSPASRPSSTALSACCFSAISSASRHLCRPAP
mgnify:CR=1 FL=1